MEGLDLDVPRNVAGEDAPSELAGLDRDTGIALLDRAADTGLLTPLGGYYQIHPALRAEEANLLHALDLARAAGLRRTGVRCLQGLRILYGRTGRDGE
jgi:hypothetical protein